MEYVSLTIDIASTARALDGEALAHWARTHSAFISSEMQQLGPEREAVATRLRELGMRVEMFEDLGGRDEDAERAYLDAVARSDVYVGIIGDRYGTMLGSGRSPTHEEYLEARRRGKKISVWLARDGTERQGNARDFAAEVQAFHTTGNFGSSDDLAERVARRIAEIAADDEAPWVKVGDAIFRADSIRDEGRRVEINATVRDDGVGAHLIGLRPDNWGPDSHVQLTTDRRSGRAQIEDVVSESSSRSITHVTVTASVEWADGSGDSMAAGVQGYAHEDLVELGLRAALFGEPLPERLEGVGFMVDTTDPLAPLRGEQLSEASFEAIARLLVTEELLGKRRASRIEAFEVGPAHQGARRVRLAYREARRYSNVEPGLRELEGVWRA